MPTSTQQEIDQLRRRLEHLQEQAEEDIRQQLKEARHVVANLEHQLSEITGRPTASEIKIIRNPFAPITDKQLEMQILFVLQKEPKGLNAVGVAGRLNQGPQRIRQWIKAHPGKLRREGRGTATKYFGS